MPTNYHLVQTLVLKCFKGDHKVIRCKNSLQMVLKVFLIPSALLNDVSNKGIQIKIRYFEKKKDNCFGYAPCIFLFIINYFIPNS